MKKETGQPFLQASFEKSLHAQHSSDEVFTLQARVECPAGITAILGRSGSGKTLCLDCLAGFLKPDAGRIFLNEKLLFDADAGVNLPPQKRRCAYIFQDHTLFPHLSVRDNLRFAASVGLRHARGSLEEHRRIGELLESFELTGLANRLPAQLSGGEKQRAALARTLVNPPQLLLLDEPTRGLDERLRQSFYNTLQTLSQRLRVPILLVSHESAECLPIAERLLLLHKGRVLQAGPTQEILAQPASSQVASLLNFHTLLPAVISALDPSRNFSQLRVLEQIVEGPYLPGHLLGDTGLLCVRSSLWTPVPPPNTLSCNQIVVQVRRLFGDRNGWTFEVTDGIHITCPATLLPPALRTGDHVTLYFPKAAVSFLSES